MRPDKELWTHNYPFCGTGAQMPLKRPFLAAYKGNFDQNASNLWWIGLPKLEHEDSYKIEYSIKIPLCLKEITISLFRGVPNCLFFRIFKMS